MSCLEYDFIESRGLVYPIREINGQRIFGPPKEWPFEPPTRGTEVFIGRIPVSFKGPELFQMFSAVGRVYEMRLMTHFSGLSRGYGFLRFSTPEEADIAILVLNKRQVSMTHKLGVVKSRDNTELCLRHILPPLLKGPSPNAAVDEFIRLLTNIPTLECRLFPRLKMAILSYENHRSAVIARRAIHVAFSNMNTSMSVDWALPRKVEAQSKE